MDLVKDKVTAVDYAVVALIVALGLWAGSGFFEPPHEDSYIILRYAKNIIDGHGWVFNPGQKTNVSTTTLYPLLIVTLHPLFKNCMLSSHLIDVFSLMGAGLFTYLFLRALGLRVAGLMASALVLTCPPFRTSFGVGSVLYLLMASVSFYFYVVGRLNLCAMALALFTLARPDGSLLALVLVCHYLYKERKLPLVPLFLYLGILSPWLLYSWFTFGTFLPQSLPAKIAQSDSGFFRKFFPTGTQWGLLMVKNYLLLTLFAFLAPLGLFLTFREKRLLHLLFAWICLYTLSYAILNVPYQHWYYVPIIYGGIIFSSVGAEGLLFSRKASTLKAGWVCLTFSIFALLLSHLLFSPQRTLLSTFYMPNWLEAMSFFIIQGFLLWSMRRENFWRAIAPSCFVLYGALFLFCQVRAYPRAEDYPKPFIYSIVAQWIKGNTPSDSSIGGAEMGVVGYYSGRKIVDIWGLLTPETAKYLLERDYSTWIKDQKPDYLLFHQPLWGPERLIAQSDGFQGSYHLIKTFSFPKSPDQTMRGILVYRRGH